MSKVWTREEIKDVLSRHDDQVGKALVKLYEMQTPDEQTDHTTRCKNGAGFNGVDAQILSSFAEFYMARHYLSPKQLVIARKKIMKYVGQLTDIANA